MGTVYEEYTVAELERRCHREGTYKLSPTAMSTLAVKILRLVEELAACATPDERVELLRREFEVDTTPYPEEEDEPNVYDMVVETRKFDSYGEFMGSEKTFMMRSMAEEVFETTIQHYFDPARHTRLNTKSLDDRRFKRAELDDSAGTAEYIIELREITEEDMDDE